MVAAACFIPDAEAEEAADGAAQTPLPLE
jgi:hypothetical protein